MHIKHVSAKNHLPWLGIGIGWLVLFVYYHTILANIFFLNLYLFDVVVPLGELVEV